MAEITYHFYQNPKLQNLRNFLKNIAIKPSSEKYVEPVNNIKVITNRFCVVFQIYFCEESYDDMDSISLPRYWMLGQFRVTQIRFLDPQNTIIEHIDSFYTNPLDSDSLYEICKPLDRVQKRKGFFSNRYKTSSKMITELVNVIDNICRYENLESFS